MKLDPHGQLGRVALFGSLPWQNLFLDHRELSLEMVAVLERFAIEYSLFSLFQYSTNISYQSRLSKLVMIISSSTCTPYDTDTFPFYLCHTILFSFKLICFSISFPSFSTYSFFLFLFFTLHFWISFHITYFAVSPLYLYIICTNVLQNTSYTSPQSQSQSKTQSLSSLSVQISFLL